MRTGYGCHVDAGIERSNGVFLVIEDEPAIARTLVRSLKPFGEGCVASTVAEGVRAMEAQHDWTALIIDVRLPDGSGFEILERARAIYGRLPALIMTGSYDADTANRAYDLGAPIVCKPFGRERIEAFVRDCWRGEATSKAHRESVVQAWQVLYALTTAETAILRDAVEGTERPALSTSRGIASSTLKTHIRNLLQKTGDRSLLDATQRALRQAT